MNVNSTINEIKSIKDNKLSTKSELPKDDPGDVLTFNLTGGKNPLCMNFEEYHKFVCKELSTEAPTDYNLDKYEDKYIDEFKNNLPVIDRKDEKIVFKDLVNHNKRYYMFNKFYFMKN